MMDDATSRSDLVTKLKNCNKCLRLVDNGHLIITYDELKSIELSKYRKNNKLCIIVNSESRVGEVGHWYNLIIFFRPKIVVCSPTRKS